AGACGPLRIARASRTWRRIIGIAGGTSPPKASAASSGAVIISSSASRSPSGRMRGKSSGRPSLMRKNASLRLRTARRVGSRICMRASASGSPPLSCSSRSAKASTKEMPAGRLKTEGPLSIRLEHLLGARPQCRFHPLQVLRSADVIPAPVVPQPVQPAAGQGAVVKKIQGERPLRRVGEERGLEDLQSGEEKRGDLAFAPAPQPPELIHDEIAVALVADGARRRL